MDEVDCDEVKTEDVLEVLGADIETETAEYEEDGVFTGMHEQPAENIVSIKATKFAAILFFSIFIPIKEKA